MLDRALAIADIDIDQQLHVWIPRTCVIIVRAPMPADPPSSRQSAPPPKPPDASLRQVVGAVLWSFFGVRKGRAMHRDVVAIRPHQVILVGIAIAALLVAALLLVVHVIVASAS